jgi:hypothetical protein
VGDFGEHMCGRESVLKRLLVHAGAFNPGHWMRTLFGVGMPEGCPAASWALGAMIAHCGRALTT